MHLSQARASRLGSAPAHYRFRFAPENFNFIGPRYASGLPAKTYNTKAVAKLYQERWEIESGFRDIKSSMQQNAMTLRSKKVELKCPYQVVYSFDSDGLIKARAEWAAELDRDRSGYAELFQQVYGSDR